MEVKVHIALLIKPSFFISFPTDALVQLTRYVQVRTVAVGTQRALVSIFTLSGPLTDDQRWLIRPEAGKSWVVSSELTGNIFASVSLDEVGLTFF